MASLRDLAETIETVEIRGKKVETPGISTYGFILLNERFPAFSKMIESGEALSAKNLIAIGPDFLPAAIAAGCGWPGDAEAESVAAALRFDEQIALMNSIAKATMPAELKGPLARTGEVATPVNGKAFKKRSRRQLNN